MTRVVNGVRHTPLQVQDSRRVDEGIVARVIRRGDAADCCVVEGRMSDPHKCPGLTVVKKIPGGYPTLRARLRK